MSSESTPRPQHPRQSGHQPSYVSNGACLDAFAAKTLLAVTRLLSQGLRWGTSPIDLVPLARKLASKCWLVQGGGHDQSGAVDIQITTRPSGEATTTDARAA